jgi:hypothetical protein
MRQYSTRKLYLCSFLCPSFTALAEASTMRCSSLLLLRIVMGSSYQPRTSARSAVPRHSTPTGRPSGVMTTPISLLWLVMMWANAWTNGASVSRIGIPWRRKLAAVNGSCGWPRDCVCVKSRCNAPLSTAMHKCVPSLTKRVVCATLGSGGVANAWSQAADAHCFNRKRSPDLAAIGAGAHQSAGAGDPCSDRAGCP